MKIRTISGTEVDLLHPEDAIEELAADLGLTREQATALLEADRQAQAERDACGNCGKCRHYKPDPEAGRRYFGEPNEHSGWCLNPAVPSGHRDYPHADMLSGDRCELYEAIK